MRRSNPVLKEALHGLAHPGPPEMAYLNCLALQALVLVLWWPKSALFQALLRGSGPDTLFAVVVAFGFTLAYWSLRAGAEECLPEGHRSLREWAFSTPLPCSRIVVGYLAGHCVRSLGWLALSAPLLAAAFAVGGGDPAALVWGLALALVQGLVFRLLGASLYLQIGHLGTLMFLATRVGLAAAYAAGALALPLVSHLAMSYRLFEHCTEPPCRMSAAAVPGLAEALPGWLASGGEAVVSLALLALVAGLFAALLTFQLRTVQRAAGSSAQGTRRGSR